MALLHFVQHNRNAIWKFYRFSWNFWKTSRRNRKAPVIARAFRFYWKLRVLQWFATNFSFYDKNNNFQNIRCLEVLGNIICYLEILEIIQIFSSVQESLKKVQIDHWRQFLVSWGPKAYKNSYYGFHMDTIADPVDNLKTLIVHRGAIVEP